jgi:hypothetical protein
LDAYVGAFRGRYGAVSASSFASTADDKLIEAAEGEDTVPYYTTTNIILQIASGDF